MAFGYAPQGSGGMSYCNQTPFPPREGWGLGTDYCISDGKLGGAWERGYLVPRLFHVRGGAGHETRFDRLVRA